MTNWVAAAILVACSVGAAWADEYPTRPVRLVVPFPAGSATDQLARVIATRLNRDLGQPLVIDY
jgi:tripartite-type tricarboxylate transporter receptor subunit TctC